MPVMNGFVATAEIRKLESTGALGRNNTIIAMTGHMAAEERRLCIDAGMDDVLTKPVRLEVFRSLLIRFASPTSPSVLWPLLFTNDQGSALRDPSPQQPSEQQQQQAQQQQAQQQAAAAPPAAPSASSSSKLHLAQLASNLDTASAPR